MVKEYVYYDHLNLEIPLQDHIEVVKTPFLAEQCLITNHPDVPSHLIAPEIDFYLKNSEDTLLDKALNVSTLFEARALCYDFSQDSDYTQEVGRNIVLVGDEEMLGGLKQALKAKEFAVLIVHPSEVAMIEGHLGALHVTLRQGDELHEVDADQMVWFEAPEFALRQSGVLDPEKNDIAKIVEAIEAKTGTHAYKNFITYDPSICQYHERREEICGKCAEVCPTVAIVKLDDTKHLKFSHIDCHGCGGCISVCPSGAVEYAQMPRRAFYEIAKLYQDKTALIVPRKMSLEGLHVSLPTGVLPLAIEGEKFLHEAHVLTLLQESGSAVVFYTDFMSKGTGDVISILNQAYEKMYGTKAVHVAMNEAELAEALQNVGPVEGTRHGIQEEGLRKREIFSARLAWAVGEKDYGTIQAGEHVRYGTININEDACTLCLSCVGACNVRALTAHPEDNSLRFDASICTSCGYCEATCPEKECLSMERGEIVLNKQWFGQRIMAKDTLFECVNCGKPFATSKAVSRIASLMAPIFAGNDAKIKSLYCCADCKPKMMFEDYLKDKEKAML
ncbi:MAG: 4Fe-4S dicluster domain-containing protein [Campylobacterales bacterium]|nr:4Fe-4S dicluster domain-containing protein [Campylobacterales bacterium]